MNQPGKLRKARSSWRRTQHSPVYCCLGCGARRCVAPQGLCGTCRVGAKDGAVGVVAYNLRSAVVHRETCTGGLQRDLEAAGVHLEKRTIQRHMAGHTEPGLQTLQYYALVLEVDPRHLLHDGPGEFDAYLHTLPRRSAA